MNLIRENNRIPIVVSTLISIESKSWSLYDSILSHESFQSSPDMGKATTVNI